MTQAQTQSPIDMAIAQAQAAAAAMAQPQANVPAEAAPAAGAVANYNATPASPLGLDDMLQGSLDVNHWMKVSQFGINFGEDPTMFKEIPVTIDMASVQYNFSVRYGNPAKYEKTHDHVTDVKGRPWIETLRMAQQQDPKAAEFRSADIPFTLRGELKDASGKVICEDGAVLGHSVSMTGWKFFSKFTQALKKAGLDPYNGVIDVTLKHEFQKNDKGQWGVITYLDPQVSA